MEVNVDSVCNWIKSKHKSQKKNYISKTITIKLFKENNRQISTRLFISYNKNTGHINFGHGISYLNKVYFPDKYINKLKCINKHTIEQYKNELKRQTQNNRTKVIPFKLCNDIILKNFINYNINTNNITIGNIINYKNKPVRIWKGKR